MRLHPVCWPIRLLWRHHKLAGCQAPVRPRPVSGASFSLHDYAQEPAICLRHLDRTLSLDSCFHPFAVVVLDMSFLHVQYYASFSARCSHCSLVYPAPCAVRLGYHPEELQADPAVVQGRDHELLL